MGSRRGVDTSHHGHDSSGGVRQGLPIFFRQIEEIQFVHPSAWSRVELAKSLLLDVDEPAWQVFELHQKAKN